MNLIETSASLKVERFFAGKKIVVTGAVGSVGQELVRNLLLLDIAELHAIDNNESALFDAQQLYSNDHRYQTWHADITNECELLRVLSGTDFVFHAAALKHVPSCERSPSSAINTNIIGVQTLISAARQARVKKVLFTSSDKAVESSNVMGATKLIGERLMATANVFSPTGTIFSSTRFGNVAGSRGSVVPLFCEQLRQGQPLTLTDQEMTRFMMSNTQAAELLMESMFFASGGETFVAKMPAMRIVDLAHVVANMVAPLYGRDPKSCKIIETGARPGEKLWEALSSQEESRRTLENDKFLCILPAFDHPTADTIKNYKSLGWQETDQAYHSQNEPKLSRAEIAEFLMLPGVMPNDLRRKVLESHRKHKTKKAAL